MNLVCCETHLKFSDVRTLVVRKRFQRRGSAYFCDVYTDVPTAPRKRAVLCFSEEECVGAVCSGRRTVVTIRGIRRQVRMKTFFCYLECLSVLSDSPVMHFYPFIFSDLLLFYFIFVSVFLCFDLSYSSVLLPCTALQAGRSRVRFPVASLEFFIDIIPPAALWPQSRLSF
jgi:hypothetical protein